MDIFNLYIKSLASFHEKAVSNELPFNLYNPILVRLEANIGFPEIKGDTVEQALIQVCDYHYNKFDKGVYVSVSFMHSTIVFVNELFSFYNNNLDEFLAATEEINADSSMRDSEEYWLFAWHPSKVLRKTILKEQLLVTEKLWHDETKRLQKALYNTNFLTPFGDNNDYFKWLRDNEKAPLPRHLSK